MRFDVLGDMAIVVRDLPGEPWAVANWLRKAHLPGIRDVTASYESLGVYFQPGSLTQDQLRAHLETWTPSGHPPARQHRIPVCYELGEDTEEVSASLSVEVDEISRLHASVDYQCFAVGFCPGFGYLGWLPTQLQGLPRRSSPRVQVEAGSVGITGKQTAAYPLTTPGGWWLIGRTPLTLVDVDDDYFPLTAGDRVEFYAIDPVEFQRLLGERL